MPQQDPIVTVGLLTQQDVSVLGQLKHAFPIDDYHEFDELVRRIDEAEGRIGLGPLPR